MVVGEVAGLLSAAAVVVGVVIGAVVGAVVVGMAGEVDLTARGGVASARSTRVRS